MTVLRYDVEVNASKVDAQLRSLEKKYAAHARRVQRRGDASALSPGQGRLHSGRRGSDVLGARVARDQERAAMRAARVRERAARQAARAEIREARRSAREQMRAAKAVARERTRFRKAVFGRATRNLGNTAKAIGGTALNAAAAGGTALMVDAAGASMRADAKARELANQAVGTAGGRKLSRKELRQQIMSTASTVGMTSGKGAEPIIDMMRLFTSIGGDFTSAQKLTPFLSSLADASGSDYGDTGRAAGQVYQSAIAQGQNAEQAVETTRRVMQSLGGMAKIGSIELRELSTQMGALMSSTSSYKGDVADLAATMGAVGQMSIAGGASSPAEAMTALSKLAADIAKGGDTKFKRAGIDVFTDKTKTQLRDPAEIILDAVAKNHGSIPKLRELFGDRAIKAVDPFRQAYRAAGGGDKGIKAMRDALTRYKSQGLTKKELNDSAAERRQALDRRVGRLRTNFNEKLGPSAIRIAERILPALEGLVEPAEKAADAFARLVEAFSENPYTGIGLLIASKVSTDIGSALIGQAVKAKIMEMLTVDAGTDAAKKLATPSGGPPGSRLGMFGTLAAALGASAVSGLEGLRTGYATTDALGVKGPAADAIAGFSGYAGLLTPMGAASAVGRRLMGGDGPGATFGALKERLGTPNTPNGAADHKAAAGELKGAGGELKGAGGELKAAASALAGALGALNPAAGLAGVAVNRGGGYLQ